MSAGKPEKATTNRAERHQPYGLADVRVALGRTQRHVAERARMTQGDVSVLENRQDFKVSTLSRYARALGGRVEACIVVGDRRYVLELPR